MKIFLNIGVGFLLLTHMEFDELIGIFFYFILEPYNYSLVIVNEKKDFFLPKGRQSILYHVSFFVFCCFWFLSVPVCLFELKQIKLKKSVNWLTLKWILDKKKQNQSNILKHLISHNVCSISDFIFIVFFYCFGCLLSTCFLFQHSIIDRCEPFFVL